MGDHILSVGPFSFGLVIGWVTYRTLRHRAGSTSLSDIATVIGAVGGAAVTSLFETDVAFGWYSFGLAVGFFAFYIVGIAFSLPTWKSGVMMMKEK